jgi:Gpi18-like mannosyltransferase
VAPWAARERVLLVAAIAAGVLIRLTLLPSEGLRTDIDQFVGWVHHIAIEGLPDLYSGTDVGAVSFGPVMAYIWSILAVVEPRFETVTDASDPGIRALMKLPAVLADLGMAAMVAFALRRRARWSIVAAAAVLLVPVTWYSSAWWGQYESVFVLPALAGVLAASTGHNRLAAACFAVSLATKPQAIPLIIPFVALCWARGGIRETVRCGLVGAGTLAILWLPFVPAGGPVEYLEGVRYYQDEVFDVLSARAWNPWLLIQELAAGGTFIADDVSIVGPLTLRVVGYGLTAALSVVVMAAVLRDPRPRTLVLASAASCLVFFVAMTQMHERYAYAAVILPVLVLREARLRVWWLLTSTVVTLDLLAASLPAVGAARLLTDSAPLAIVGSILMTASTAWLLVELRRSHSLPHD